MGGEATVLASDIIRLTDLKPHQEGWVYSQQVFTLIQIHWRSD